MLNLEIKNQNEVWTEDMKVPGNWIVANIETSIPWPVEVKKIQYDNKDYWIIPITKDAYPGIAARVEGISLEELQTQMMRLLSVISWVEGQGAVLDSFTGGNFPRAMGRSKEGGYMICEHFDLPYLPVIESEPAKLALALMREGRGINHPGFAFLSFFKVFEIAHKSTKERTAWMEDALTRVEDFRANEAIKKLASDGIEHISDHLYESGRCAIAHAKAEPLIDPDEPADSNRLHNELPIITALAEMAIEEVLAVKTARSIYREHLYELAGFKRFIDASIIKHCIEGQKIPDDKKIELPAISVRLRGIKPFLPLEKLRLCFIEQDDTKLVVVFGREDRSLQIKFLLNFADERLEFDIHHGLIVPPDDGSHLHASTCASLSEFAKLYFLNGCLEIVDADTGEELSRKDAFMPVNVFPNPEGFDRQIEYWVSESKKRQQNSITT